MKKIVLTVSFLVLMAASIQAKKSFDVAAAKAAFVRPESIPQNPDNPLTEASVALGKDLFFEPRISDSGLTSCATCHNPSLQWEDNLPLAVGNKHLVLARSTPTIINAAWNDAHFWDGRADTLEEQALGPIEAEGEMAMPLPQMLEILDIIPGYAEKFEKAYPGEGITSETVAKAIANYERTIVSAVAPFDRWIQGDESAISDQAKHGFELFNTKGECVQCHSGWNFSDSSFHDIGVRTEDKGRGAFLGFDSLNFHFKTPTLRNVEERAPYMHNGSESTLREVLELYNMGGREPRPTLSSNVRELHLSSAELAALEAFLKTLSSRDSLPEVPQLSVRITQN